MQQIIEGIKLGCILLGENGGIKLKYINSHRCVCYGKIYDCSQGNKECPNCNLEEIFIGKEGEKIKMDDIIESLNKIHEYTAHYVPYFHYFSEKREVEIKWEC